MNADKRFEDMLVTPKLILRWIREGDVYVNRLGEDEMKSCKLQVEAALAQPEQPMSPEHLSKYIATNGVKPMEGGGGGGSQPEQEPVAWLVSDAQGRYATIRDPAPYGEEVYEPLYAAPPKREWVGLTDEERVKCYETTGHYQTLRPQDSFAVLALARAIEAALRSKNT